jgi:hypothetical protein
MVNYYIIMNCVHFSCTRFFYLLIIYSIYTYFKAWSVFHLEQLAIEIIACLILSYKKNLEHIFRSFLYIYDLSALCYLTIYLLIYVRKVGETKSRDSHNWKTEWQLEIHADMYEFMKSYICKRKTMEYKWSDWFTFLRYIY